MLKNLRAEMARKNVTNSDLATVINVTNVTIISKISETSQFNRKEMYIIHKEIFPDCKIEYLFESDKAD